MRFHLPSSRTFGLASIALLSITGPGCFSTPSSAAGTNAGVDAGPRGCLEAGQGVPPMAPQGYYVNGATVCTAAGQPHLFHGVDRPSLEFEPTGENISAADFQMMASWNANVVRIALNQDYWLANAALYYQGYEDEIKDTVAEAEAAGLDVILDLHWSDRGNLAVAQAGGDTKQDTNGGSNQQQMADQNSLTFWSQVATDFKDDGHVLFELYNEPNGIPWSVWLNGGESTGFEVAGMQQLYKAVRDTGANNVVIAGGLSWAFDLSAVTSNRIVGYNIMYATHPYNLGGDTPSTWESRFGYLATQNVAPVIATEFGDPTTKMVNGVRVDACSGTWDQELIAFADSHQMSWTAWAWYPGDCAFPSLISDWNGTPTVQGAVVSAALAGYPSGPRPPAAGNDGGAVPSTDASGLMASDASAFGSDAPSLPDTSSLTLLEAGLD